MTAWMRVAVGERVRQPLEHDDADAVADDRPGGPRVERAAVSVGREDHPFLVQIAGALRHATRYAAGERDVALAGEQAWQARWTATSDVEQAVCTLTLGPRRLSL